MEETEEEQEGERESEPRVSKQDKTEMTCAPQKHTGSKKVDPNELRET